MKEGYTLCRKLICIVCSDYCKHCAERAGIFFFYSASALLYHAIKLNSYKAYNIKKVKCNARVTRHIYTSQGLLTNQLRFELHSAQRIHATAYVPLTSRVSDARTRNR